MRPLGVVQGKGHAGKAGIRHATRRMHEKKLG